MSDIGRHDLALELIANIKGREAIRLRSDILWAARRWREAAEQIELLYGERWRDFTPLSEAERADILRAAIGFALGEEPIGLGALAREIRGQDGGRPGPPRLRRGERADRHQRARNSRTSPRRWRASIRSTPSCATCARAIRRRRLPAEPAKAPPPRRRPASRKAAAKGRLKAPGKAECAGQARCRRLAAAAESAGRRAAQARSGADRLDHAAVAKGKDVARRRRRRALSPVALDQRAGHQAPAVHQHEEDQLERQ